LEEVLFFDPMIDRRHKKAIKYRDKLYWKTNDFGTRTTRKNHVEMLRNLNIEYGENIKGKTSSIIGDKLLELQSMY